jgi:NAD+ synthase (glutamine-hydrolysing)
MPYGYVKCGIANFNSPLSNSKESVRKIKELITKADEQDAKILIFPELCITHYTCQDLFEFSPILNSALAGLKELVKFSANNYPDMLFAVGAPLVNKDTLYNCAVVIQGGEIKGVVPKQYIPNYGEFYEKRWFTQYEDFSLTSIRLFDKDVPFGNLIFNSDIGYRLGIEICEDLWSEIPPSSFLALAGANIIGNLSASNIYVAKEEYRSDVLLRSQSSRCITGYLYSSAGFGESTSDLVFDGSGYIYENGKKLASLERFQIEDQLQVTEIDINALTNERIFNKTFADSKRNLVNREFQNIEIHQNSSRNVKDFKLTRFVNPYPFVPSDETKRNDVCEEILKIQSTGLAKRLEAIGCKKVTLGISGGLDSTLALIVCIEAFKKLNLDYSGILGVTMPGFGTTNRTHNNSVKLCEELGVTIKDIPIKDACLQHFKDIGHDPEIHDITYENVQARERTQILMDLANKIGGILVGTGDLSELVLGWCTYNGDHMSMYNVNTSVPKTLVKYLIESYAIEVGKAGQTELKNTLLDIINTPISPELLPSDGKEIVQKTEENVGPYVVIDFFISCTSRYRFTRNKTLFLAKIAFGEKYSDSDLVKFYDSFAKRFPNSQFKRNCMPDGPKVGNISVSPRGDLRMPSDLDPSIFFFDDNPDDPYPF